MNPITHLLTGWTLAENTSLEHRDRALVAWAAVVPDLDGVGMGIDLVNAALGPGQTYYYAEWHHQLMHGLPAAAAIGVAAAALGVDRRRVGVLAFAAAHLHFLCDLVGSRGPSASDIWPIHYLAPVSNAMTLEWAGQWELNAWPNVALTVAMMGYAFLRAAAQGRSPVSLFSARANEGFVWVARKWTAQARALLSGT